MAEQGARSTGSQSWLLYAAAAIGWPVWCELFVALGALGSVVPVSGILSAALKPAFIGVGIVAACVSSYLLGRLIVGRAPARLWVVTIVWLAIVTASAVLAYGVADVRDVVGFLGVLGPFLFGAIGFTAGLRRGTDAGRT